MTLRGMWDLAKTNDSLENTMGHLVIYVSRFVVYSSLFLACDVHTTIVTGRCPSGDNPYTCVDEEKCQGVSQYSGGIEILILLRFVFNSVGIFIALNISLGQYGNLCHVDCSNRGKCNYNTGTCTCFNGTHGENCGEINDDKGNYFIICFVFLFVYCGRYAWCCICTVLGVDYPDCSPTAVPTVAPTLTQSPTFTATAYPSSQPSPSPTSILDYPSRVLSVNIDHRNRTSITVLVQLQRYGVVFCGAYNSEATPSNNLTQPLNTLDILRLQNFVTAIDGYATMTLDNLVPATSYGIYCGSYSSVGAVSSFTNIVGTALLNVYTLCCRDVYVDLSVHSLLENSYALDAVTISTPHLLTEYLNVTMEILSNIDNSVSTDIVPYPAISMFTLASAISTATVTIQSTAVGEYTASFILSGPSSELYSVVSGRLDIKVVEATAIPDVPVILTAAFSDSGGTVLVSFDSNTNRGSGAGALSNFFECSTLLAFVGSDTSQCQWSSDSTVIVYPSVFVYPGNQVSVVNDTIRAKCPTALNTSVCAVMNTAVAGNVTIDSPANPSVPNVIISAPSEASGCVPLTLDLTVSSGSVGRNWISPVFDAYSSNASEDMSGILSFLHSDYVMNPPIAFPMNLLLPGNTYTFEVTLCNFLHACGVANTMVSIVAVSDTKPTVVILGSVSLSIHKKNSLMLNTDAYTKTCTNPKSYANLSHTWTIILVNEENVVSLDFTQVDPTKFFFPSYSLEAKSWYSVRFVVTNVVTNEATMASVTVNVLAGDIVAIISGGSMLSFQPDNLIFTIDGSESYDEDNNEATGAEAGLFYEWSCNQVLPYYSTVCPFRYSVTSDGFAIINSTGSVYATNTTGQLTMIVFDSSDRIDSTVVNVVVLPSLSPIIHLDNVVSPFSAASRLVITGTLQLYSSCTSLWSVTPKVYPPIESVALTPVSVLQTQTGDAFNVYLALPSHALSAFTAYTFSFSCGENVAQISTLTSTRPAYGDFVITPGSGIELDTVFTMTASNWFDENIPLTYLFLFLSEAQTQLVAQGQSEVSYALSVLPGGNISCSVRIYNFLGDTTVKTAQVVVNSTNQNSTLLQNYVDNQLSSNVGNQNAIQQTISTVGSVVNVVNCSSTPDCASFNRDVCSDISYTCGECLEDFVGRTGSANELCTPSGQYIYQIVSNPNITVPCTADTNCSSPLDICVDGTCITPSKSCSNNCFGNGNCTFIFTATGKVESECKANNVTCSAVCACDGAYSGKYCDVSVDTNEEDGDVIETLLSSLNDLVVTSTPTTTVVSTWISSLATLTEDPHVLTTESSQIVFETAALSMQSANDINMSYIDVLELMNIIDCATTQETNLGSFDSSIRSSTASVIDLFTKMTMEQLVPGEAPLSIMGENFRTVASSFPASPTTVAMDITIPQNDVEILANLTPSSVTVDGLGGGLDSTLSVVENRIGIYGSDTPFNSNPIRITGGSNVNTSSNATFVMQNALVTIYPVEDLETSFNTTCFLDLPAIYIYNCYEGHNITHVCTGKAGFIHTVCPVRYHKPSCNVMDGINVGDEGGCMVTSFDDTSVTCSCPLQAVLSENSTRRLENSDSIELEPIEIVTITVVVAEVFAASFSFSEGPHNPYIVISMFSAIWAFCAVMIGMGYYQQYTDKKKMLKVGPVEDEIAVSRRGSDDLRKTARKMSAIIPVIDTNDMPEQTTYDELVSYIESIIPSIYTRSSIYDSIKLEVLQHHTYMSLFDTVDSEKANWKHVVTAIELCTATTFFLYIIAIFSELDVSVLIL